MELLLTKNLMTTINEENFLGFSLMSIILLSFFSFEAFAMEEDIEIFEGKVITDGDLYIDSVHPIRVSFEVTAVDKSNDLIPVQCDKNPNSLFDIGKTKVRCMAIDSEGNQIRDSFVVTVGYNIIQIPDWFKQTTEFWVSEKMSDKEYFKTVEFLLEEKLIHIPQTKSPNDNVASDIPVWIKDNALKWSNNEISNDEFSIGLQWMLDHKLIKMI